MDLATLYQTIDTETSERKSPFYTDETEAAEQELRNTFASFLGDKMTIDADEVFEAALLKVIEVYKLQAFKIGYRTALDLIINSYKEM